MGAQWSQFFPPAPTFDPSSIPLQAGRIFLITGGASGIGLEVAKVLYRKGGTVYIAGRSEAKAREAIASIEASPHEEGNIPGTEGKLAFLHVNVADLSSIAPAVAEFTAKESRLDVLFNNAGVSQPPAGSLSAQGLDLQLATNAIGPFLLTRLLLPVLRATSAAAPHARVVWVGSQSIELQAAHHGFTMDEIRHPPLATSQNYANSKTANLFMAAELARRYGEPSDEGGPVVSVAVNPGNAKTNLSRHTPWLFWFASPLLYKAELAAVTELYAGLSDDIAPERHNGCYVVPWGRIHTGLRTDLVEATKTVEDGGVGRAKEFWEYCEEVTEDYH
jgi:NAD(P)-dependent dehydrogenase (short-subunit alcohol dehydrogenase family)